MNQPTDGAALNLIRTELDTARRLRAVEVQAAVTHTALDGLTHQVIGSEKRLLAAIEANKPKPIWPAVSAIIAALAIILVIAERLYAA